MILAKPPKNVRYKYKYSLKNAAGKTILRSNDLHVVKPMARDEGLTLIEHLPNMPIPKKKSNIIKNRTKVLYKPNKQLELQW